MLNRFYVRERGKGKKAGGVPLVLLHGFPFAGSLWEKQLDALDDEMWAVAPDMPGFGQSTAVGKVEDATVDDYADAIAAWAKGEGIDKLTLAGHSMGGYVALAFARRYPQLLHRLVLVATKAGADTEAGREGRYKMARDVEERGAQAVVDAMLPKLFAPSAYDEQKEVVEGIRELMMNQNREGIRSAIFAMASRPDSGPGLADIDVPTLIISGAEDAIMPAAEAETMRNGIKGAQHVAIEGAGHLLMLEDPTAFNRALREFLNNEG